MELTSCCRVYLDSLIKPSFPCCVYSLLDLLGDLRPLSEWRLCRCDQHHPPCVCRRNCWLLITNICNKPHRWDQPGNEDFNYCVFGPSHVSPNDPFAPGLWGTVLACVLVQLIAVHWRDFVISYRSPLHVLWWWVKIRAGLCCFEIPLSFEHLSPMAGAWPIGVIPHVCSSVT